MVTLTTRSVVVSCALLPGMACGGEAFSIRDLTGDASAPSNDSGAPDLDGASDGATVGDNAGQTGTDAGTDVDAGGRGCMPGSRQCSGVSGVQTCGDDGQWSAAQGCPSDAPICTSGECVTPPTDSGAALHASCEAGGVGLSTCGPGGNGTESCCTSLLVPGGSYERTYTSTAGGPTGEADPATVSSFLLDKYVVTVARFRQFVQAWNNGLGWLPTPGSGKHTHLNGGRGLANDANPGTYETGWVASDDSLIEPTSSNLESMCTCWPSPCQGVVWTWSPTPGATDMLPINCVDWAEAYAFCIWDGGFLPSEAEWEYVAAGGSQQRKYSWGSVDPGSSNQYAIYGCNYPNGSGMCTGVGSISNIPPVGTAPAGAAFPGQLDVGGEVWQWTLGNYAPYVAPCNDCAYLNAADDYTLRGGSWWDGRGSMTPANRNHNTPGLRDYRVGFRCARSP